ncbi:MULTISPECIES: hypothetical protein [Rhodobacterales]|jgi:hypothetical protein|uniref:Uncharacterized protein n=1 Tax=Pseudodonghicola flavimaris TaxID=3050036 RepID=A0ABT7F7F9_9RHOB|nr:MULTISPECIES: hypothetical protein [Rhodobacterales]MDW3118043.1 hypothetical protein [Roseovarius pacificus]MDE4062612.1 hypothetical protein [Phaeobacter gallaeciensis]MDE4125484.1 hypothetical protein [Phaeobacter gallaeciensis]MDE4130052.1 hypothetical protein [Phaeobacter gallaeciensis]MDK3020548.1 hypothetical protein [Pseudodonghicola flavimaris]
MTASTGFQTSVQIAALVNPGSGQPCDRAEKFAVQRNLNVSSQ